VVTCHNVLTQLRADGFQQVSNVTDPREVAEDRVFLLTQIVDRNRDQNDERLIP
jgi:hypothetical protein